MLLVPTNIVASAVVIAAHKQVNKLSIRYVWHWNTTEDNAYNFRKNTVTVIAVVVAVVSLRKKPFSFRFKRFCFYI